MQMANLTSLGQEVWICEIDKALLTVKVRRVTVLSQIYRNCGSLRCVVHIVPSLVLMDPCAGVFQALPTPCWRSQHHNSPPAQGNSLKLGYHLDSVLQGPRRAKRRHRSIRSQKDS